MVFCSLISLIRVGGYDENHEWAAERRRDNTGPRSTVTTVGWRGAMQCFRSKIICRLVDA